MEIHSLSETECKMYPKKNILNYVRIVLLIQTLHDDLSISKLLSKLSIVIENLYSY